MKRPSSQSGIAMLLLIIAVVYSCSKSTFKTTSSVRGEGATLPDGTIFTRVELLDAFGTCILSEIEAFETQSRDFKRLADEAVDATDEEQLQGVREAWEKTIDIWQRLELMQVGPSEPTTRPGGEGIRAILYPWPHRDHCELDRILASELYVNSPTDLSAEATSLWAAEYLLFSGVSESSCAEDDPINENGSWADIDEATRFLRRARYTAHIAGVVADAADRLLTLWSPDGENFLDELTQAGESSRTFGKKRVALNAVSDALGYIEWGVKDHKLARPLGLIECDAGDCSEFLEARYSRRSKRHLRNNLEGFRKIFNGCGAQNQGLGFDDYLYAMGEPELAEEINAAAQAVEDAIDAIDEPDLLTALEADIDSVRDVHSAVATLSSLLRREFLIVLNLELPQMVQGDND